MSADGQQRVDVALLGAGISKSLSPALHEREGRLLGFDYRYRLLDVEPDLGPSEVARLVEAAHGDGLAGLNVTHPFKRAVVDALDELSPEAAALGAVNTIVFSGDRASGHNTDLSGFRKNFESGLPGAATDRVVVIGAGGAGAAVAYALAAIGAGEIRVVDVDPAAAAELAAGLEAAGAGSATSGAAGELGAMLSGADGLVHATPTGMREHPGSAVAPELLSPELWVAEVVYMPLETELLASARAAGCRILDGGDMVAHQAADSLELFTGVSPDRRRMAAHLAELVAPEREAA